MTMLPFPQVKPIFILKIENPISGWMRSVLDHQFARFDSEENFMKHGLKRVYWPCVELFCWWNVPIVRPRAHYAGGIWKRRFFLWKRIKCFPSTPRWGNLKETLGQGNHMIVTSSSSKSSVFKFLRFEGRFRKAPFFWRISVDRRPNRTNINLRRSVPESINSHHVNSFALVIDTLGIMKMTRVPPYHSTWGRDSEEVGDPPSHPTSKSALI